MLITRPWALYNEIDEYAADWLENLIRLGVIAPGVVDRRSIEDLRGDDLRGFRQCHFFAGIGVWSYALRCAGIPDDAPLWTGSCPCQPFSAAGKGTGMDDERHLWPTWFHLIQQERPPRIYGEQVASKDGLGWLDLVLADMEAEDYSIWAVDTCSAGSGAPHIRQRLRFFAYDLRSSTGRLEHTGDDRSQGRLLGRQDAQRGTLDGSSGRDSAVDRMASSDDHDGRSDLSQRRPEERTADGRGSAALRIADLHGDGCNQGRQRLTSAGDDGFVGNGALGRLADASGSGRQQLPILARSDGAGSRAGEEGVEPRDRNLHSDDPRRPGPTNGFWRDADWLFCRDGKWRPVESGTFPLVDGSAFRMGSGGAFEGKSRQGMLRCYGNAVDLQATIDFIEATLEPDVIDALRSGSDEPCQSPLELYTRSRRDIEDLA